MGLSSFVSSLFGRKAYQIQQIGLYADDKTLKEARKLIVQEKATLSFGRFSVSKELLDDFPYPVLHPISEDRDVIGRIIEINRKIEDVAREKAYHKFSKSAMSKIISLLSPSHLELNDLRTLLALQLVSAERIHVYILADPQVLSSELLRFAAALHEPSVFVTADAQKIILADSRRTHGWSKGVIGLHPEGLLCIDEIDNLKETDAAALTASMEKETFYEEGDKKKQRKTTVKVLATSNAQSGRFVGKSIDILRKQVPVPKGLLLAFHFVLLVRDNGTQKASQFKIHRPDYDFIKGYCAYASSMNIEVSSEAEEKIYSVSEKLKLLESSFIRPFDNQLVVGMIRLAKANARMRLRKEVTPADIDAVASLLEKLLVVKREDAKGR
jgi:DNA replicative helicase MCM subunit Mcm2 (Cdc46/Mcm family)